MNPVLGIEGRFSRHDKNIIGEMCRDFEPSRPLESSCRGIEKYLKHHLQVTLHYYLGFASPR